MGACVYFPGLDQLNALCEYGLRQVFDRADEKKAKRRVIASRGKKNVRAKHSSNSGAPEPFL